MYFVSTLRILHLPMLIRSCILIKKLSVLERQILMSELKKIICTYRKKKIIKFAANHNS